MIPERSRSQSETHLGVGQGLCDLPRTRVRRSSEGTRIVRSSPLGHSHLGSVFRRCLKGAQPPLMLGLQLRAAEEQRNQYTSQRFLHVVARGAVFGGSQHVRAVALSLEEFRYAFTNTLSEEESQAAYERYAVPGPGRVRFQVALANFNPHAATKYLKDIIGLCHHRDASS